MTAHGYDPLAAIPDDEQTDADRARIAEYRASGLHGSLWGSDDLHGSELKFDRCAACAGVGKLPDGSLTGFVVCDVCDGSGKKAMPTLCASCFRMMGQTAHCAECRAFNERSDAYGVA